MDEGRNLEKKRLCIIGTRGYPSTYGGFETAVRFIAPFLASKEFQVIVYSRKGFVNEPLIKSEDGVKTVFTRHIPMNSLSTLSHGLTSTFHAIKTRQKVALVMNVANGYWIPILKIFGIKTLVNVDGIESQREKWNFFGKKVFHLGAFLTSRYADRLIFDSQAIGSYWKENFNSKNGTFIPYGSLEFNKHETKNRIEFTNYIIFIARLVPENSIDLFLESAKVISKFAKVVIVGSDGNSDYYSRKIQNLIRTTSNIIYLGHISDQNRLLKLWSNALIYFHGHTVGGTNPSLVQAMRLGVPTIAVDTVFNREVLGNTGVFVNRDSSSVIRGVTDLLRDGNKRKAISYLSRIRAEEIYTWEKVCKSYLDEIRKLLK